MRPAVDGAQVVVTPDGVIVVRDLNGHGEDGRVVVAEIQEPLGADDEAAHRDLVPEDGLLPSGDHAQLRELCHRVA